jgi:tetratricopeptide (TPR) repeat protein
MLGLYAILTGKAPGIMTENRGSRPKVKAQGDAPRGASSGRRPGRNTTFQAEVYKDGVPPPIEPQDLLDPEATGARLGEEMDGFYQPTAMLDKGELLGELAEIAKDVPDTRAAVETETPPRGCRLIIVAGPDIGTEWAFKQAEIVLGRDEECELVMPDIGVSRRHAKITLENGKFILTDFGSGNGTYLNGVRIQREDLASGDEILIGERTLRFVELNDPPATAAAHPVPLVANEPVVGSVPKIPVAKDPALGKASQVDVGVVPKVDGPEKAGSLQAPGPGASKQKVSAQGAALRKVLTLVGAIAFIAACAFAGWTLLLKSEQRKSEIKRQEAAKRHFLQGIELVKALRFGDALLLFDRVAQFEKDEARAKRAREYKEHCEKELKVWDTIEAARKLAESGRHAEALGLLEGVKEDTAYGPEIERLKKEYSKKIAEAMLKEARAKLAAGDYDGALEIAEAAIAQAPSLSSALTMREEIEEARREANKPKPKPKDEIPPELFRAVALYKNDQIGAAIDAAEAAGGTNAQTYVARMKRVKSLLAEAEQAHRKKAAAELLRIAPAALEVDQQISDGDGKVRSKLKGYYADGLYLKGIEAYQDKDFVRAYQLLNDALKQKPGHQLSETRLAELSRKARDLYYEGYVLKDSNPAETRKVFRRLTQMTKPDNQYHRLAEKWLVANGG